MFRESVLREARMVVERHRVLSNLMRVLVLAIVASRGEASWGEIKGELEELMGAVNPNALAFHLSVLMRSGYVSRVELGARSVYKAVKVPDDIRGLVEALRGEKR